MPKKIRSSKSTRATKRTNRSVVRKTGVSKAKKSIHVVKKKRSRKKSKKVMKVGFRKLRSKKANNNIKRSRSKNSNNNNRKRSRSKNFQKKRTKQSKLRQKFTGRRIGMNGGVKGLGWVDKIIKKKKQHKL